MCDYIKVENKVKEYIKNLIPYKSFLPLNPNYIPAVVRRFSEECLFLMTPYINLEDMYTWIDSLLKEEKWEIVNQIYSNYRPLRYIFSIFYFDLFDLLHCDCFLLNFVYRNNTLLSLQDKEVLSTIQKISILYNKIKCEEIVQHIFKDSVFTRKFIHNIIENSHEGYIFEDV